MRLEDAPPAGWYPDPEGSTRLRWWEGTDWADRYRAFPSNDERGGAYEVAAAAAAGRPGGGPGSASPGWYPDPAGGGGQRFWDGNKWTDQLRAAGQHAGQIVDQVRAAAREEMSLAAQQFGAQARYAVRDVGPLVSEYTNKAARLLKRLVILVVVLAIAWFVFQAYANMTFFEWIGDRIDNLTEDSRPAIRQLASSVRRR